MSGLSWALLGSALVVMAANWTSRLRRSTRLEQLTKPLATILVIALALSLDAASAEVRTWFVLALVACLAGDVMLMPPFDAFVPGLIAFLVGHLLFLTGLVAHDGRSSVAGVIALVAIAGLLWTVGRPITSAAAERDERLGIAVSGYLLAISVMAVIAWRTGDPWAIIGATAFVVSDALLGWNRFVRPVPGADVAIMVTYHAALLGLTLSLL